MSKQLFGSGKPWTSTLALDGSRPLPGLQGELTAGTVPENPGAVPGRRIEIEVDAYRRTGFFGMTRLPPSSVSGTLSALVPGSSRRVVERHDTRVSALPSALMAFGSIFTDLCLPAVPATTDTLHAGAGTVDWTIGAHLIGFGVGQLLGGLVGDRCGRRGPAATGLVLLVPGSIGYAMSASAGQTIGWRVVHALGACAGVVPSRTMVRDHFPGERAAQMLSTLVSVMAVAPLVGPIVGGLVLRFGDWRRIFWAIAGVGTITLVGVSGIPEPSPPERRSAVRPGGAFASYALPLRDARDLGYAGAGGMPLVGTHAYIAASPIIYTDRHGMAPQICVSLFGAAIFGIRLADSVDARPLRRFGGDRLLRQGATLAAACGLLVTVAVWTGRGGLPGLFMPSLAYCAANCSIIADAFAGAPVRRTQPAGAASAQAGSLQYGVGVGVVGAGVVTVFADGTPVPLGIVVALGGVGYFLRVRLVLPPLPRNQRN